MTDLHEIKTTNDAAREVVKASLLNALTDPEMLDRLVDALTIEPCHVTGMHDPTHTERYLCDIQHSSIVKRLLETLGLTSGVLPKRLHETCGWCHDVPTQEEYRKRLRSLHQWAGEEISEDLAAPAPDAPREGDDEIVLAALRALAKEDPGEWVSSTHLDTRIEDMLGQPLDVTRRNLVWRNLVATEVVEEKTFQNRVHVRLVAEGPVQP